MGDLNDTSNDYDLNDMLNELDFDSIEHEYAGDSYNSDDYEFGDFNIGDDQHIQTYDKNNIGNKQIKKEAIVIVIVGIVVMIIALIFIRVTTRNNSSSSTQKVNNTTNGTEEVNATKTDTTVSYTSEWSKFNTANGLSINKEYIQTNLTVTAIEHYVKVVNDSNIMVKTLLKGTISGFVGTYELSIPYSKGSQLSIGNTFDIEVQIGKLGEKVVINDIKY